MLGVPIQQEREREAALPDVADKIEKILIPEKPKKEKPSSDKGRRPARRANERKSSAPPPRVVPCPSFLVGSVAAETSEHLGRDSPSSSARGTRSPSVAYVGGLVARAAQRSGTEHLAVDEDAAQDGEILDVFPHLVDFASDSLPRYADFEAAAQEFTELLAWASSESVLEEDFLPQPRPRASLGNDLSLNFLSDTSDRGLLEHIVSTMSLEVPSRGPSRMP